MLVAERHRGSLSDAIWMCRQAQRRRAVSPATRCRCRGRTWRFSSRDWPIPADRRVHRRRGRRASNSAVRCRKCDASQACAATNQEARGFLCAQIARRECVVLIWHGIVLVVWKAPDSGDCHDAGWRRAQPGRDGEVDRYRDRHPSVRERKWQRVSARSGLEQTLPIRMEKQLPIAALHQLQSEAAKGGWFDRADHVSSSHVRAGAMHQIKRRRFRGRWHSRAAHRARAMRQ